MTKVQDPITKQKQNQLLNTKVQDPITKQKQNQLLNTKVQDPITKQISSQKFDLEERTLDFAKEVISFLNKLPRSTVNFELTSQIIRSAGSIGANYREANDALGRKDFFMRLRISRKEAKETKYWLELIMHTNNELKEFILPLLEESDQLIRIFSSIIKKDI